MGSPVTSLASVVKSTVGSATNVRSIRDLPARSVPGGKLYATVADMTGYKSDIVGSVRTFSYVPSDPELEAKVRVEWTRNAFGFWYRVDFSVPYGDSELPVSGRLREIIRWIRTTATGSVSVGSMNRMFTKVKKNTVKDRANGAFSV